MTYLIVLFNLKDGVEPGAYEEWAAATDLPTVRSLESCDAFDVYRTAGVLGSDAAAPYQYVEIIRVTDMPRFGEEVRTETMQRVAGEFRTFAESPVFMLSERLEG